METMKIYTKGCTFNISIESARNVWRKRTVERRSGKRTALIIFRDPNNKKISYHRYITHPCADALIDKYMPKG